MATKRTIDSFFTPESKKQQTETERSEGQDDHLGLSATSGRVALPSSNHATYPFPILELPVSISRELASLPARPPRAINDQPDLDLLYFQPYVPPYLAKQLYEFLKTSIPFYRVEYDIKRGGVQTHIRTPRYTTVFGLDNTSRFDAGGDVVDVKSGEKAPASAYARYRPRPIPKCLDDLRRSCEAATGCEFNFCLVNYYASGADSISYHSDDERFLGPDPAIASFSLGAQRDFLLKHKPTALTAPTTESSSGLGAGAPPPKQLKFPLASGDMILMRGKTQSNWLHSVPKRTGKNQGDGGRINITFRRAMVKAGTDNYYNYNVGTGPVFTWDEASKGMSVWQSQTKKSD